MEQRAALDAAVAGRQIFLPLAGLAVPVAVATCV